MLAGFRFFLYAEYEKNSSILKHWQEMQYMLSALQIGNRTAPNPGPPFQSAYIKDCKL